MGKNGIELRLLVSTFDNTQGSYGRDRYFKSTAQVVYTPAPTPGDEVAFPSSYGSDRAAEWNHFAVTAQMSASDGTLETRWYGYQPEFRAEYDGINLSTAQSMVKVLRMVDSRMQKLTDRFGHPNDWPTYLGRLAACIGADLIGYRKAEITYQHPIEDGSAFRWGNVDQLRYHIDKKVAEWMAKYDLTKRNAS